MNRKQPQAGFTLVEMVVVIIISGVLALVFSQMIQRPVEGYAAASRRAMLVDIADTAFQQIGRELRRALPNSVRIGCGGQCLEFVHQVSGGRYRLKPEGDALSLSFDPVDADSQFQVLGPLPDTSQLVAGSPGQCANSQANCLVIYNTGLAGGNLYNLDNAASLTGLDTSGPAPLVSFDNSGFSSGLTAFPTGSPEQRFYLADGPISYLCNSGSGTLTRYSGYNLRPSQSEVDTPAELAALSNPAESALLADRVSGCQFTYTPGSPTRNALVTLELTLQETSEKVVLLQQVHIANTP